jgi:hypothetical protein
MQLHECRLSSFKRYFPFSFRSECLWTWPLLFLVIAGILFLRQPAAICHPGFVTEDGFIFFKQGYEQGAFNVLLKPYAGYLQIVPRALAALGSLFPLRLIPLFYASVSLLFASTVFTFFYSARFRPLIASDTSRVFVILLFSLMPNSDSLMRLTYLPWYMLLFISLVSLMELPREPGCRSVLFVLLNLALWSTPVAMICLPVIVLRLLQTADRRERLWWGAVILSMVAYALTADRGVISKALDQPGLMQSIVHAIGYRVFCFFFLGSALAKPLLASGWEMVDRFSFLLAGICVFGALMAGKHMRGFAKGNWTSLILVYLILALPALFVLRSEFVPHFLIINDPELTWSWHQRYFFCSTLLLCVLGGMVHERVARDWLFTSPLSRAMGAGLLICWISLHTATFSLWPWHYKPGWKHFAREIQAAEIRVNQTGTREIVHIPNTENAWAFDLIVEKKM